MSLLSPMAMSQTKDELLRHLDLPLEVYNRMAKETDQVYKWLTSEKSHLKKNCEKISPPYDWSDIKERSKDEAMERVAGSTDEQTSVYWSLAEPVFDCPNWIARWFLYHKFRYRDMRNRNASGRPEVRSDHTRHAHKDWSHGRVYKQENTSEYGMDEGEDGYHGNGDSTHTSTNHQQNYSGSMSSGMHQYNYGMGATNAPQQHPYTTSHNYTNGYNAESSMKGGARSTNQYWDPVRDASSNS